MYRQFDNLKFVGGRLFFNISKNGCGSRCIYCYTKHKDEEAEYYSADTISASIDSLENCAEFISGEKGTLVSFCSDTEPFKSNSAISLVQSALEVFLPMKNSVQLATKEAIPKDIIDIISKNSSIRNQVVVFVSLSTISRASLYEPNAAPVAIRFANFSTCRRAGIRCCLYIKPFLPHIQRDIQLLTALMEVDPPDALCIGVHYKATKPSKGLYQHPVHDTHNSAGITRKHIAFRQHIASLFPDIPIFMNATCVSAYFSDREPPQYSYGGGAPRKIWIDNEPMCVNCRTCGQS